ncbi:MAG: SPFH domain-containing protein [Actinomycetota bacterium]|nr:SPFH domain-containing protein [Actinomycetota bacterium]
MPELFSQTGHAPERLVVDWPEQFRTKVVLKWPDSQIRKYAEVRVDPDAVAIFTSRGEPVGAPLAPGRWPLDEGSSIGLDWLVDLLVDDSYYGAELYYVSTRDGVSAPFGGSFGEFTDPFTGATVTVRGYGEFVYRVAEPWFLVSKLEEPGSDVASDDDLQPWVAQRVVAAVQAGLPALIQHYGVLALEAVQASVAPAVLDAVNAELDDFGLAIEAIPQLTLNISDEDRARVGQLSQPPPVAVPTEPGSADPSQLAPVDELDDDDDDDVVGVDNMFMAAAMGMGFPDPDHDVFEPEPPPVPSIPLAEDMPGFPPPPPPPPPGP